MFFPASGNTGGANNQGTNGNFWASSEQSATNGFNLNFNASNVNPANVNNKTNRFSVRCVRSL